MDEKFIVTPKSIQTVTMTIRIEEDTNDMLEGIVTQSGRSRNEIINMALKFALNRMEFNEKG